MKKQFLENPHEAAPTVAARCTAHNRSGARCKKTPVAGWSVCRMHGAGGGRPVTSPATIIKRALEGQEMRDKAQDLLDSGVDVLDLRPIAAQLHVMAGELSDKRNEPGNTSAVQLFLQCLESLRKTAETVERIRASKAFTKDEFHWVILKMSEFVEKMPPAMQAEYREFIRVELLKQATSVAPLAIE